MNKVFLLLIGVFLLFGQNAAAATRTWDGEGATNSWSEAANWSGNVIPASGDDVVFNSTSVKNATIDTNFTVNSVALNPGYAGIITQTAALTVTNAFTQSVGTFQGGADNLNVGSFQQTGGIFTAPAGVLNNSGFFSATGGTFNHNNGTVSINGTSQSLNAPVVFYNLTFTNTTFLAANPTINGVLTLQNGQLFGAALIANGNVVYGAGFSGGQTQISFQDAATRTVQLSASNGLLGMSINNPNITVRTSDSGASSITYTTNLQQGRLEQGAGDLTFIAGAAFNQSGGTFAGSAGNLNLNSNTTLSNGNFSGGTGSITYTSGTPLFSQSGGSFSTGGNVNFYRIFQTGGTFNAPVGTLTMSADLNIGGGTFNSNGGTIVVNSSSIITQTNQIFNNLTVNSGYNTLAGTNLNLNGTLSLVDGTLNGNPLILNGNVTYAATFDGGSAQLQFSNAVARTVNLTASNALLGMIVDNPNITVTTSGANASTFAGIVEVRRGALQQGNAVLNFSGALNLTGGNFIGGSQQLNLNSLNISGGSFQGGTGLITGAFGASVTQSGGSFSAQGNVEITSFTLTGGTFNAPAGTLTVVADYRHQNGGTFNAGTGTVRLTGYQTFNCINQIITNVTANETFYNLQLDNSFCNQRYLTGGGTLIVTNNFRLTTGSLGGGRIRPLGATTIDATYAGYNSSTVVEYITPNTNFVINNPSTTVNMMPVEMNAANSTLTNSGSGQINFGALTLANGTVNQGAGVWDFSNGSGYTQSGGTFNGSGANLNLRPSLATGIILAGGAFQGGSGLITGDYRQTGGVFSTLGDMKTFTFVLEGGTFNAPAGTLTVGQSFTHTLGGTFNAGTGTVQTDSTQYQVGFNIGASETFYNLRLNGTGNNANHGIPNNSAMTVNGTLTFNGRGANGGSIIANGDVVYTNYGGYQNATTLVRFEDTATRTVTFGGDCLGYYMPTRVDNPNITINSNCADPAQSPTWQGLDLRRGTVNILNSRIAFTGNFTQSGGTFNGGALLNYFYANYSLTGGTFNPAPTAEFHSNYAHNGGTFNYGTGTVKFVGTGAPGTTSIDVNTTENFYNVVFSPANSLYGKAIAAGDTIVANGDLSINGGGYVSGGTLEAKRNLTISGGFLGGDSNVVFSGAVDQTYTNNNFNSPSGTWTVNKPNSLSLEENNFAPAAPTTLFLSGNISNPLLSSPAASLNIVSGNVVQTGVYNHTLSALTLAPATSFSNRFGGTLILAGDVTNDGSLVMDGNGAGCQADAVVIRSSQSGVQRAWNGNGTFRMVDTDVRDQSGSALIHAFSSTDSGNNGANWTFDAACAPPTAASVMISGRVTTADGRGVLKARVEMIGSDGVQRVALTNPLGYYNFADVQVGNTYVFTVSHKKQQFKNPTQAVFINDETIRVDFSGND